MKKSILAVAVLLFALLGSAFGQKYTQFTFASDFVFGPKPHGVVVDRNGLIWIGFYDYSDTIFTATKDTIPITPIWVYKPDGTQASFSPIRTLTIAGKTDTLATFCRGLSLDNNGNILFVGNQVLYRINYQNGAGMQKYLFPTAGSLTEAACDANGFIYVTRVSSGQPLLILDQDLQLYGVVDTLRTLQRTVVVSPDGKDVYIGTIYSGVNGIRHYHGDQGPDGEYALVDTIGNLIQDGTVVRRMWAQCLDWGPDGLLWAGTYFGCSSCDASERDFHGWYALDPKNNWAPVDSFGTTAGVPKTPAADRNDPPPVGGTFFAPRGIAFSSDALTIYTADYNGNVVKKWTRMLVSVDTKPTQNLPANFKLFQNYPNPFNPTTTIPYDIVKNGFVKLIVYDRLGREVSTLVNKPMTPGHYEANFDATGLASGVYYYRLTLEGQLLQKQMIYLK